MNATAHSLRDLHALSLQHCLVSHLFTLVLSFFIRVTLVALFLPFSAMDKLLNTDAALKQAQRTVHSHALSWVLLGAGGFVEVFMSLAVLTGFFDRIAAAILAGYCMVTALLFKRFWKTADFRLKGPSKGRDLFWDFLKNFAVAGGFLMLATGGTAYGVTQLLQHPLSSSHPYSSAPMDVRAPNTFTSHLSGGATP